MAHLAKKTQTQFDLIPGHITNLGMGAPADSMLAKCTEVMKTAVKERMVSPHTLLQSH